VGGGAGGETCNALSSGRTFLGVRPFFRSQQIKSDTLGTRNLNTNGIEFDLLWDNRDYLPSPSRGYAMDVRMTRDFGALDSDDSWTATQLEIDGYIDLSEAPGFRQRVLALDF